MNHRLIILCCATIFLSLSALLQAEVKVPSIFGDHMILQQGTTLPVWGVADAGEKVTVAVGGKMANATADVSGKWRVNLPALPVTDTPLTMTIAGKNTLTFQDVLVGEVWFASGQSNMGFSLKSAHNAATIIPEANDPQLRFFHVGGPPGLEPSDALAVGKWVPVTPEAAPGFSAVAYFFGRELRAKLNSPVAILQSAWGGTAAEAWTPIDAIQKNPTLKSYADSYDKVKTAFPQASAELPAKMDAWHQEAVLWEKEVGAIYNPLLTAWKAEADKAKAAGQTPPPMPQPSRPRPQQPPPVWGGAGTPSVLYNGEVAPVVPYAIRGVIWYQGESNAPAWASYQSLFSALITGWRAHWSQGDFPFLFVQLPKWIQGSNWPQMREAQAKTLALPNTAMSTIMDVGDPNNIHPVDKLDVGKRLALVARHAVYGEKDLVWTGPVYASMKVEGNAIRVSFTQTGGGLVISSSPWTPPNGKPISTTSLLGFAVALDENHWFPAEAKIDGNTVLVSSDKVPNPVAVRYAWQNSPDCNLYNKEGLPASPFRTDDWHNVSPTPLPVPPASGTQKP